MAEDEDDMLANLDSRSGKSGLGCQLKLGGDLQQMVVTLPPVEY